MSEITRKRFEKEAEKVAEWVKETRPKTVEEIERKAEEARREEAKVKRELKKTEVELIKWREKHTKEYKDRLSKAAKTLGDLIIELDWLETRAGLLDFDADSTQLHEIVAEMVRHQRMLDNIIRSFAIGK